MPISSLFRETKWVSNQKNEKIQSFVMYVFLATGFSLISYDSRIHLGFIADVASVASKEDCDEIVNDVFKNIDLLKLEVEKKKLNIF